MVKGYSKTLAQEVEIEVIQCIYLGLWVILRSRSVSFWPAVHKLFMYQLHNVSFQTFFLHL